MYLEQILAGVLLVINIFSFIVVANDKRKAASGSNTNRTPEGIIFFMAACFGGIGVYAGILVFRNKTKKWYFQIGIPLLILQNLATLYVLREML